MRIKIKEETKKAILSALLEAGFVVLGVVLALLGNEWHESVTRAEKAEMVKASIVEELKANRAAAAASLEYHHGLLKMLRESREKSVKPAMHDFSKGFIFPARLNRTAWTSAAQTGIMAHLPYSEVLNLSEVYSLQERYEDQARSVGLVFYGEIARSGMHAIVDNSTNLGAVIAMFAHREKELVSLYDHKLAKASQEKRK